MLPNGVMTGMESILKEPLQIRKVLQGEINVLAETVIGVAYGAHAGFPAEGGIFRMNDKVLWVSGWFVYLPHDLQKT